MFNVDGEYYVTDDQCTHGPGLLSEGYIDGDVVECNFHNGQFNIKTGEVASPPCMVPIKTYGPRSRTAGCSSRRNELSFRGVVARALTRNRRAILLRETMDVHEVTPAHDVCNRCRHIVRAAGLKVHGPENPREEARCRPKSPSTAPTASRRR